MDWLKAGTGTGRVNPKPAHRKNKSAFSSEVVKRFCRFYRNQTFFQFGAKERTEQDHPLVMIFYAAPPPVAADSNAALDTELSLNELHAAEMSLENGKAPGIQTAR